MKLSHYVQIHETEPLCTRVLSLAKLYSLHGSVIHYTNGSIIDYTDSEKVLGVWVNLKFKSDQHQEVILNKVRQMLGITMRSYHYITDINTYSISLIIILQTLYHHNITDINKRRSLYISLVRSLFEHCSTI